MKRLICLILVAALLFILCACFGEKKEPAGSGQAETLTEEKNAEENAGSSPKDTGAVNGGPPSATSSQTPTSSTTPASSTSTTSTTTTAPTSSTTSPTTTTKAPTTTTKAPTTTTKAPTTTTTTKGTSPIISDSAGGGTATEFGKTDIFK